jgi:hypothetical protein
MGARLLSIVSFLFPHFAVQQSVSSGMSFRRVLPNRITESVVVLKVSKDSSGIQHVRYSVAFERPDRDAVSNDERLLALPIFTETYMPQGARAARVKLVPQPAAQPI